MEVQYLANCNGCIVKIKSMRQELCEDCHSVLEVYYVSEDKPRCTFKECTYCIKTNICKRFKKYLPLFDYLSARNNNYLKIVT